MQQRFSRAKCAYRHVQLLPKLFRALRLGLWKFHSDKASIMMNLPKKVCCRFALAVGLSSSASAQIAQERPELCGKENQPVPLPANVSAIQGDTGVFSTLLLKIAGSEVPIAIQLTMRRVEEVCPISKDRLLVVGDANPATPVAIVDEKVGKLMDWFYAYNPTVSPNQHWLVLQDFYPPQSEVRNSEEYLLYDLTVSIT